MRKKWIAGILIAVMTVSLGMTGCSKALEQNNVSKDVAGDAAGTEMILKEVKDEYYMLSVSDYEGDLEEVLEYLIEDYSAYKDQIETTENQVETTDGWKTQYQYLLKTEGPAYLWKMFGEDYLFDFELRTYANGVIDEGVASTSVTDAQAAKELAISTADVFDADLTFYREETTQFYDKNHNLAEVVAIYGFRQNYKGVPLSFSGVVNAGTQMLSCPAFNVVIDGNGIRNVTAFSLFDIGEPIKSYHVKEFISLDEVERKIVSYCSSFNTNIGNEDYTMTATIESGEIVYIPYMEQNEKVLIPAYELMVLEYEGEEVWRMHYIVDVFTGYVYYRTGVDQLV